MNKIKLGDTVMLWCMFRKQSEERSFIMRDVDAVDLLRIEAWVEKQTLDPDIYAWAVSVIIESSDY
jgi:hypothetical protein